MKAGSKKDNKHKKDDSLFGLLSSYKFNNTYFRILVSEDDEMLSLQLTDNPGSWKQIEESAYKKFKILRRLEIGCTKLSIKYINPRQLIMIKGESLGASLPSTKTEIIDHIEDLGFYIINTPLKYKKKVFTVVNNLLKLTPQKKYEIIEKCIAQCLDIDTKP
ncbi:MAG: hypothetical protein GY754_27750 [bacterium]|nr:hypothetical protein [bacterium]